MIFKKLKKLREVITPFGRSGAKLQLLYFYSTTQMLQNRNILKYHLFILVLTAIKMFSFHFKIYVLNFRT